MSTILDEGYIMNERLSKIAENVIVITYVFMAALTFIISIKSLGIILGTLVTIVICIILLFSVIIISFLFTPELFPDKRHEKESQPKKECEEGTIICSIQKKTKEAILQYLKHRDAKYLEDGLTVNQISSGKEYEKLCEQRNTIEKSKKEKSDNENKLKYMIRDLFRSIPEKELWFKINLLDKEFGISKQGVETKKFDKYGSKLSEGVQDSRKDSTKITAIYIKPWGDNLSYNKNNDSYIFCEGYSSRDDRFHIANNDQIDMFTTEHWKK